MDIKSRCNPNPWLDDKTCKTQSKLKEDNIEILREIRPKILSKAEECLPKIEEFYQTNTKDQSVYTGTTGAALLHLKMALQLYVNNEDKKEHHLLRSLSFLTPSLKALNTRRHTFLCGYTGPVAIATVVYTSLGKKTEGKECLDELISLYCSQKQHIFAELPCEMLYGISGLLYSLMFVNSYIPGAISDDIIGEIEDTLIKRGLSGRDPSLPCPLMYTWHDKHYIGAAHGLAGILTLLLQDASSSAVHNHLSDIKKSVDYILSLKLPSGNTPSSLESMSSDRLIQWCHGAPGVVHLWALAYRVFNDSKYLQAAVDCADVVWKYGVLKKGCGLCHGVSGNGYTFIQLYRLTGDHAYLHRAVKFAEWCLSNDDCSHSDRPWSLFEGLSGMLYFLLELCCDPESGRYPSLELPYVNNTLSIL